eukprot:TRINITY_DN13975_c0_g1_i1.p1 TRINITY_DN13975_c0_g1~~TRINITY_DN13975_c0_g1_i1.p1  ORF type:complete len:422 (+),score=103.87 TRINITY_DN13975_c0_g1_i1:160-1425(+)
MTSFFRSFRHGARATFGTRARILTFSATGLTCSLAVVASAPLFAKSGQAETPEYLLPFYLRSFRARFNHFASVKSSTGGRLMTPTDFVNSLIGQPGAPVVTETPVAMTQLFRDMDHDGDGTLSFPEYSILMTLVTTSRADFDFAFRMFDVDSSGKLSHREFCHMIKALCPESVQFTEKILHGPLVERFFGTHGSHRELTLSEFWSFVEQLRVAVWDAEFDHWAAANGTLRSGPLGQGTITLSHLFDIFTASHLGSHLSFPMVAQRRKLVHLEKQDPAVAVVPRDQYHRMMHLVAEQSTLMRMLDLYQRSGLPVRPQDFLRAVNATAGIATTRLVAGRAASVSTTAAPPESIHARMVSNVRLVDVHALYRLFDLDGDGSLSVDEFKSLASTKMSFNTPQRPVDESMSMPARFLNCMRNVTAK